MGLDGEHIDHKQAGQRVSAIRARRGAQLGKHLLKRQHAGRQQHTIQPTGQKKKQQENWQQEIGSVSWGFQIFCCFLLLLLIGPYQ